MNGRELLYHLLPAIYRIRDQEPHAIEGQARRDQLRALLGIIEEQHDDLEQGIAGLYDDWFIETCAEWIVPYIGDLLGVRLLHDTGSSGLFSQRALVANTIRYRRRKGTLLALEELARDVSGWNAHAVEFFQVLGWTQNLNHLRYETALNPSPRNPGVVNPPSMNRVGTVNLRSLDVIDRIDGPFDLVSHTVDVRPICQLQGWHNIRNIGIFTWRLQSYPMRGTQARASNQCPDGFHFSSIGHPAPLFTNPEPKDDEKGPVKEVNVPGAIRPVAFFERPEDYYGSEAHKSFAVYRGAKPSPGNLVPLEEIMCTDLGDWPPAHRPKHPNVAVDVERGRIVFEEGKAPAEGVTVAFHHGFSADIGGGPYDRRATLEKRLTDDWVRIVAKKRPDGVLADEHETTLHEALGAWTSEEPPKRAIIIIADNAIYEDEISIELDGGQHLFIQADDRNHPTIRLVDGGGALSELIAKGAAGNEASLTLDGLQIEGGIRIDGDGLRRLEIRDCTLVPGRALREDGLPLMPAAPSLVFEPGISEPVNPNKSRSYELEISIERSIVGPLRLPASVRELSILDSIVDKPGEDGHPKPSRFAIAADDTGLEPGPKCTLERVTILGDVFVHTVELASEVIFAHVVNVIRSQFGCVRYSYVDDLKSATPRRFRCQPDLALATRCKELGVEELDPMEADQIRARVRPRFKSMQYGRPDYAQLVFDIADEIWTGAEDGAEMGVFEHLKQPQRVANLRARLEEYAPYGLETGIVYVT